MKNKKLFCLGFVILSCCEFGQFAYSKNVNFTPSQQVLRQCVSVGEKAPIRQLSHSHRDVASACKQVTD